MKKLLLLSLSAVVGLSSAQAKVTHNELLTKIEEQQKQINALADALETDGGNKWYDKISLGGYGELHYTNGGKDGDADLDFHRFVLMLNADITDHIRLHTELELEHSIAGDGQNGEIELEQAYIEFDIMDNLRANAGLFLLPVGILNKTHEPETFYGVDRNLVEKNIIPTTWWEGGVGIAGNNDSGFGYEVALHSGLEVDAANFNIRKGRNKVSKANADHPAITANINYTGLSGLEIGATLQYQSDITQGAATDDASALLTEAHLQYNIADFSLRALYARWDIDGSQAAALGADEQYGWYIEPSYKICDEFGVFARYSEWDQNAGDNTDSKYTQTDIGFNYWVHKTVVLKADIAFSEDPSGDSDETINLGIGFSF